MKVYNWPMLIDSVLVVIGSVVYYAIRTMSGKSDNLSWILAVVVIIPQGLYAALSKDGHEAYQIRKIRSKRVYRKLFGRWAAIAPWGFVILILLAWACAELVPSQMWLALLLLLSALVYAVWITVVCNKYMKVEAGQEREQN